MQAHREIEQRRLAEAQVSASLKEKETLLKEIHHRVKNNMQVVSSLLQLQSSCVKNPEDAKLFKECQDRIKSMGRVYNKLYQSKNLSHIDFKDYVSELVADLVASYQLRNGRIDTRIDIDDISLGLDMAIPCGLILNEIIVNSLKYAFTNGRSGLLSISVRRLGNDMLEMKIADNGIGLPEFEDPGKGATLGIELIKALTEEQLMGSLSIKRDQGSEYTLVFKSI